MARKGINCYLSYAKGSDTLSKYGVRVSSVSHGINILATQSQARIRQAFYPYKLGAAQFAITVDLIGSREYRSFADWMAEYAKQALSLDNDVDGFPYMQVHIPMDDSRNFIRFGVPLNGYEWADNVGLMTKQVQVVFETVSERGQTVVSKDQLSRADGQAMVDKVTRYFYPSGTQLSGSMAPPSGTYATVISKLDQKMYGQNGERAVDQLARYGHDDWGS